MRSKSIFLAIAVAFLAGIAIAKPPGPVILHIGPVVPTPMPSPKHEEHIRLISSFTVGNKPDGESTISFEATDFATSGTGEDTKYRTIATEQYALVDPKPAAKDMANQITAKIRDLESDLLKFVEITGPPRAREPLTTGSH